MWDGDRRAPCGERWLLEHAPDGHDAAGSPLRAAREAVRDALAGHPWTGGTSLSVRPEGLPTDVWDAHLELLVELPPVGADPWLEARIGTEREDPEAAARLVAWSTWDPEHERRIAVLERTLHLFELDAPCELALAGPQCHWELADRLAGASSAESGPPGRRDRLSDPLWLPWGPRAAGMAGDWVGTWHDWVAQDPERAAVVRPGVGQEPAAALWVGGTERGRARLEAELGLRPPVDEPVALAPPQTPGARAAQTVPW